VGGFVRRRFGAAHSPPTQKTAKNYLTWRGSFLCGLLEALSCIQKTLSVERVFRTFPKDFYSGQLVSFLRVFCCSGFCLLASVLWNPKDFYIGRLFSYNKVYKICLIFSLKSDIIFSKISFV
jgi:hypothetical protein